MNIKPFKKKLSELRDMSEDYRYYVVRKTDDYYNEHFDSLQCEIDVMLALLGSYWEE